MHQTDIRCIEWCNDHIIILDQTRLPSEEHYLVCNVIEDVASAIERLSIRGAPAIGVAAAMGLALDAQKIDAETCNEFIERLSQSADRLLRTRPTAVNLHWAVKRMMDKALGLQNQEVDSIRSALVKEALLIYEKDLSTNLSIGRSGCAVIPQTATVMTICNTGSLATAGYGTALGVIRASVSEGKSVRVVACETRPLLQGARLTAWELKKDGIEFVLITDSMAGYYMKDRGVDVVIAGADRIASNGDTANKIGTYTLSILAKEHNIPFYIAAPISTIDMNIESGSEIPVEERAPEEVTCFAGRVTAPPDIDVWNPAFDVVPWSNIDGIITESGIVTAPFTENIKKLFDKVSDKGE